MKETLKKIGLSDNLKIELPISRTDFYNTLSSNIDSPQWDFFDMFSSSKNVYKGSVTLDSFELKRRRKFFDTHMNWTKSSGTFRQVDDKVVVDIELNSFHYMMIPFLAFGVIVYGVALISILTNDDMPGNLYALMLPFLLLHAALMFGIPYFIMRRSLRSAKYDIERDIYYLMKDKLNAQRHSA